MGGAEDGRGLPGRSLRAQQPCGVVMEGRGSGSNEIGRVEKTLTSASSPNTTLQPPRASPRARGTCTHASTHAPAWGFWVSRAAVVAKGESNIRVFSIPRRSPDLNVCDYALWKQVNRTMRRQEKKFAMAKHETRADYLARLRRAALGLRKKFVDKATGDMHRRCARLYAAKGGYFQEGGR